MTDVSLLFKLPCNDCLSLHKHQNTNCHSIITIATASFNHHGNRHRPFKLTLSLWLWTNEPCLGMVLSLNLFCAMLSKASTFSLRRSSSSINLSLSSNSRTFSGCDGDDDDGDLMMMMVCLDNDDDGDDRDDDDDVHGSVTWWCDMVSMVMTEGKSTFAICWKAICWQM